MGMARLRWFCFAVLFAPSLVLAQVPPVGTVVATEVAAGTTTYRVISNTVATPSGVAVSSARDVTPVTREISRNVSGGLSQSARGQLIVAERVSTPLNGRFNVSGVGVKNAAKVALRSAPVITAGALGLQALLDTADWYFGDHDELLRPDGGGDPTSPDYWGDSPEGVTYHARGDTYNDLYTAAQVTVAAGIGCTNGECTLVGVSNNSPNCLEELRQNCTVKPVALKDGRPHSQGFFNNINVQNPTGTISCASGEYDVERFGCVSASDSGSVPVTDQEIDDAVDEFYEPDPTDWDTVFPYMSPETFTVDPVPSVQLEPEVTTSVNNDTGATTVTETSTNIDFEVASNNSSKPSIDMRETESTKTYENGVLTGDSTVVRDRPARPGSSMPSPPESGGGGSIPPDFILPGFCSWASSVCDWFDWTREPLDPEPDLPILVDRDFNEEKDISFGSKSCPPDLEINIPFLNMTASVPFQPFCDFAGIIYYLVMTAAYVSAAYISVGVARNG